MATIKQVAARAGVSVGTVSNVLNERPVKAANKERVLKAMQELEYTPNSIARMLKTRVSRTIGLIVPDISNPFYSELARGAEDESHRYRNTLFLCNKDRNGDKEDAYLDALVDKGTDGIIVVKPTVAPQRLLELSEKCPIVLVDANYEAGENYAVLNVDDVGGALSMMERLYSLGHREIYYFMGSTQFRSDLERYSGYRSFMESRGVFNERWVVHCGIYDIDEGYRCASRLFEKSIIPHAIFASNDILAIGIIQAAFDHGLQVPRDISVVGCDDIVFARYMRPTLTTLNRPKYQLGTVAVQILAEGIGKMTSHIHTLPTELVIRNSCIQREHGHSI